MTQFQSVLRRFGKAALVGALTQIALVTNGGATIHNLADVKAWLGILLAAAITGALLGLEKALNWTPTQV